MMHIVNAQKRTGRGFSARRQEAKLPAVRGDGRRSNRDGNSTKLNGAKVFNRRVWTAIGRSLNLSKREQQLLRGVFDDSTDASIASALGISRHTVHTHFERLHQKLGVPNRTRLILRVVDEFLALTVASGSTLPPLCPNRATHSCLRRNGAPAT
jgi:DNA-binding CsgD family transcriptional regulator